MATLSWQTGRDGINGTRNITEIKTDLKLLLECLKCHMDDTSVQRDSLLTTAAICSSLDEAKEFFRECGGINFVLNLLTSTEDDNVKIAALYTLGCACEKNVFSQKRLCTSAVFKFIYCQLINRDPTDDGLKRTSAFLLLCLVTNNGEGQNLARTSYCLEALLKHFRSSSQLWPNSDANCKQLDLWTAITSTLCGCVNNPQNETNQQMCASAGFPTAIAIIGKTKNSTIIRLVSSFLSLTIANNVNNQDRFGLLGGLEVLVDLLISIIAGLLREPDQDSIQAAVQLTNVFVSCITDSEQNHTRLVDLNLVSLLIQLLSMDFIESDVKLKVMITLGHLMEKCERSQRQLRENDGLSLLVHIMAENQDEELNKATMYVLSSCVDKVYSLEGDGVHTSTNRNLPIKPLRANEVRAKSGSHFIPQYKGETDSDDEHIDDQRLCKNKNYESKVHSTTNDSVNYELDLSCNLKRNQTTEACQIDDLQRQLQEEKHKRKHLENEMEALEKREEERERSKGKAMEKAEAITEELERQYKEQTPEKLIDQDIKNMAHKLEMLEKRLQHFSNVGNQLDDNLIVTSEGDQVNNSLTLPAGTMAGSLIDAYKMLVDFPYESNPCQQEYLTDSTQRFPEMKPKQLCESGNGRIRSLYDGSDIVKVPGNCVNATRESSSTSRSDVFRVPTSPIRRCFSGASKPTNVTRVSLLGPNVIRRRRHRESDVSCTESVQGFSQMDTEVESCCASVITDTDVSLSASDKHLIKQAKASHKEAYDNSAGPKPLHHRILLRQSKANRNYRVTNSSEKGMTFSVPSRPVNSQLRVNRENSHSTRDEYKFEGSQRDISGTSASGLSNQPHFQGVPTCPACGPPVNRPLLNSRNFLYTLERSHHTCPEHKELVRQIKQDICQRRAVNTNALGSTKSTRSHLTRHLRGTPKPNQCNPVTAAPSSTGNSDDGKTGSKMTTIPCGRRKRQEFTPQEIQDLIEGVAKQGKHWNSILWRYKFAAGRTSVDLKDKYRRMQAQNYPGVIPSSPSSSCKSFKQRRRGIPDRTWRP